MGRDTAGLLQCKKIMKGREMVDYLSDKQALGHSLGSLESSE